MSTLLGFWSHALAALAFSALLIWQSRRGLGTAGQKWLLAGLLLTAVWAWLAAVQPGSVLALYAETGRNLAWLALLHALATSGEDGQGRLRSVGPAYAAVAAALGLQLLVDGLGSVAMGARHDALQVAAAALRIAAAAGSLVIVHNLYGQAAPESRSSIRLVMIGLVLTWGYDLNLYTLHYLGGSAAGEIGDARGAFVALTAPLFALGGQWTGGWRLRLSRAATFQSLSLLAICSYFAVMAVLAAALGGAGWDWMRGLAIVLLVAMTAAALVLLPSRQARAWMKVKAAKHLFEHRYDYRVEWLRFAGTLGRSGPAAAPLAERVVQAFAEILDSPAGMLVTRDEGGEAEIGASWNWGGRLPAVAGDEALARVWSEVEASGRILELPGREELLGDGRLWAGVPLIHNGRMAGLVLLAAPEGRRALDWEDFDLLRTAGRQAASSLAEAHGQQALMNAQRFEEFNRRFAFILHDVKNLVSQLSLLSRNAERHADNPEFRADMIATLKGSVGKMNELLARLSPEARGAEAAARAFSLLPMLTSVVADKRRSHEVRLLGQASAVVAGDPAGLEQAVAHLLQNAIDASPAHEPVTVRVVARGGLVTVEIADRGIGMDGEFVRSRLFQPFASTKAEGFGIGAYEARSLVQAMGGRLSVESQPGEGTCFTIALPAARIEEEKRIA